MSALAKCFGWEKKTQGNTGTRKYTVGYIKKYTYMQTMNELAHTQNQNCHKHSSLKVYLCVCYVQQSDYPRSGWNLHNDVHWHIFNIIQSPKSLKLYMCLTVWLSTKRLKSNWVKFCERRLMKQQRGWLRRHKICHKQHLWKIISTLGKSCTSECSFSLI